MTELKKLARLIFLKTLAAIDIPATMQRKLRRQGTRLLCDGTTIDLRKFGKLRVVAIGKAAHAMVDGLALVLTPFVRLEGVVSAPTAPPRPAAGMKYFVAGHPVPNEADSCDQRGSQTPLRREGRKIGDRRGSRDKNHAGGQRCARGIRNSAGLGAYASG